jgi:hypothetical protein
MSRLSSMDSGWFPIGICASCQIPNRLNAAQPDDIPKSIAESVSGTLQFAEGNFIGLAEAMPEDKYSYIPTVGKYDGVRSFGEQVKHVACAQSAFFNEFEGKKPLEDCEKGGHDPAKSKAELILWFTNRGTFIASGGARLNGQTTFEQNVEKWVRVGHVQPWRARSLP